jgi:hypothetical protein
VLTPRTIVPCLLLLQPVGAIAQQIVEIPNGYSCASCRVSIERVVVLRTTNVRAEPTSGAHVARDSRGRYFVAPTLEPGQITVFSPQGTPIQSIGRKGVGPGEMEEIGYLQFGAGDSLIVSHDDRRFSVFTPQLTFARGFTLQSRGFIPGPFAFRPGGSLLALRWGSSAGAVDYPMRLIGTTGTFGANFGKLGRWRAKETRDYAGLAAARDQFWAATRNLYELDVYQPSGQQVRTFRRTTPWFPRLSREEAEKADWFGATVHALAEARDTLWILSSVARPEAKRLIQERAAAAASAGEEEKPRQLSVAERSALRQYYLEAFDPRTNRMIARASLENHVPGGFLDGGQLYTYSEDEQGTLSINVWRLFIRRG